MRINDFPSIFQEFLQPFCTAFVSFNMRCLGYDILQLPLSLYPSLLQNVLVTLKKYMHSITLDEGFLIVFRKVNDCLSVCQRVALFLSPQFGQSVFIAISSGHGETEDDLSKKMQVFNSIISFLVGPVKRRYIMSIIIYTLHDLYDC